MPRIEGDLHTAVENPRMCHDLADFTCGDARLRAEEVVEMIVAQLRNGERPSATVLAMRESSVGTLVGMSAIEWRAVVVEHPSFPADAYQDAVYLAVLTLSERYRGRYSTRSGQALADLLMTETLRQIASIKGGIPPIQAFVDPSNAPCLALVEQHGFEVHIEWPEELLLVRPRGLALPGS